MSTLSSTANEKLRNSRTGNGQLSVGHSLGFNSVSPHSLVYVAIMVSSSVITGLGAQSIQTDIASQCPVVG